MKSSLSFLTICFLFLGSMAQSAPTIGLGLGLRGQDETSGYGTAYSQPLNLVIGYNWKSWGLFSEFSTFQSENGTSMVRVKSTQREVSAGARWNIRPQWIWAPYLALGLGQSWSIIETRFASETETSTGTGKLLVSAGAGFESQSAHGFNLGGELKVLSIDGIYSSEGLLRLIYRF